MAVGHGIVLLPLSGAAFYTRLYIAYVHLSDIPPGQVCLAWDAGRRSRLIHEFAAIAADRVQVAGQS